MFVHEYQEPPLTSCAVLLISPLPLAAPQALPAEAAQVQVINVSPLVEFVSTTGTEATVPFFFVGVAGPLFLTTMVYVSDWAAVTAVSPSSMETE